MPLVRFILRFRWQIIVMLLAIPTIWNLIRPGYFFMHDDMQAMRVYQMDKCIRDFQIPCRWVPDMGYGYGYPQFNYYGPLPYYFMEAGHLLGLDYFNAVKLGFIAPFILGALTMYLLGRHLWGEWGGFLTSVVYTYSPYRASDLYSRGAMGESWAFVFMPLIILSILNLVKKPTLRNAAFLSLNLAGLLSTHNITSLIFLPFAAGTGLVAFMLTRRISDLKKLIPLAILGLFWGVAIAGFFFLPVVFEKGYAHTESMLSGYFNYLAHFVTIKQLFFTAFWGFGSSEIGATDDLSFFVGPVHLLLLMLVLVIATIKIIRKRSDKLSLYPFIFIFFGFVALFLTHQKASIIWQYVSILKYLQFPWRFLTVSTFFFALASGFLIYVLKDSSKKYLSLGLLSFLLLFNLAYFRPLRWIDIEPFEKFSGPFWDKQMTISIFDYLPIYSALPPASEAPLYPVATTGSFGMTDYQKKSNSIRFTAQAKVPTQIRLQQFDFPGWKVWVNGEVVSHDHNNELALITFTVPAGNNQVIAKLTETPVRMMGDFLTAIGIFTALYVLLSKKYA